LALSAFAAQSANDIKIPVGYRNWFHVNTMIVDKTSPLFEALGSRASQTIEGLRAALGPSQCDDKTGSCLHR
jgi:hypothetical protein